MASLESTIESLRRWVDFNFLRKANALSFLGEIDGSGSFLDADTLDGRDGTEYVSRNTEDKVSYSITTTGWKRIAYFQAGAGSRGEMDLYLNCGGGNTAAAYWKIHASHGYSYPSGGIWIEQVSAPYGITNVRITNDTTQAFVEIYITSLAGGLPYPFEARISRDNATGSAGCGLYTTETAGGGTLEATAAVNGVAGSIGASGQMRALSNMQSPLFYADPGGWGTGYGFAGADPSFFGHTTYVGITGPGNLGVMISRTDANPSYLALGIGNQNDQDAHISFYSTGGVTAPASAYIRSYAGASGDLDIVKIGNGSIKFFTANVQRMKIGNGGFVGINVDPSNAKLKVLGGIAVGADEGGQASYVTLSNNTQGVAGTTAFVIKGVSGATARTNTRWWKIFDGVTAGYVPVFGTVTG